ncbi:MAG: vitamin B12 dependent methionine synthase [Deltaproteobacteria bacterium]|nr:MAG: vitamin B12 dependent methionine synthase [Deltaproteobacteria bacterium]
MELLDNIPVSMPVEVIKRKLHIKEDSQWNEVQPLVEAALPVIAAKAVYKVCYIDKKLKDAVLIDGISFKSRVLRKNFDAVERVFPYVITIGDELQQKARAFNDLLKQYYLDIIGNIALTAAREYLEERLRTKYGLGGMSRMSPGSLTDWPIQEQKPLFSLLGDVEASIGVKLAKNLLMIPQKSISGIYFPTEISFYSCQLCPRERCPSRMTGYNEKLAREYGIDEH